MFWKRNSAKKTSSPPMVGECVMVNKTTVNGKTTWRIQALGFVNFKSLKQPDIIFEFDGKTEEEVKSAYDMWKLELQVLGS